MTATASPLSIGILGLGDHARRNLLPAVDACPDVRLAAVATRDPEVLRAVAAPRGCAAYASLDALLADTAVEAVFVATPIARHAADGMAVLEAGRHLWIEKAFAATLAEADRLIDTAVAADLAVCVSCAPLHHPLFEALTALIAGGDLGAVRSILATFAFPHTAPGDSKYRPDAGGGALLDVGFYPLTLPGALIGETPTVRSAAVETEAGYGVNTGGAALLQFPSGATLSAQWGYGRDYVNEIRVLGETGMATASPAFSKPATLPVTLEVRRQNVVASLALPAGDQFAAMLSAFAHASRDAEGRAALRRQARDQQATLEAVRAAGG